MLLELYQYKGDTDERASVELTGESDIFKSYLRAFERLWKDAEEFNPKSNNVEKT